MRLLSATTLELTQFHRNTPPYAILSHTWGEDEVNLQEVASPARDRKKRGFAKILGCCRQALSDMLEWVWIDTCCIDQTSSAELSEAINSMYAWYRDAQICYAFLEDVPGPTELFGFPLTQFQYARWFTRGWCLQELIAPCSVEFYAQDWTEIGTKRSLHGLIKAITGIPERVLLRCDLDGCNAAQKMSWASGRRTTRPEDEAYCLLGIFGINMPMLYGEGDRAFRRLQEEIITQTEDYSLLLWTEVPPGKTYYSALSTRFPALAPTPACFHQDGPSHPGYERLDYGELSSASDVTYLPSLTASPSVWRRGPCLRTRGGLQVSLPSRVVDWEATGHCWDPYADWNRHSPRPVALWTGYIYHQKWLACVLLVREVVDGVNCYVRVGNGIPALHLVNRDDCSGFGLELMFLSSSPAAWEAGPASSSATMYRQSGAPIIATVEVVLSTWAESSRITVVAPETHRLNKADQDTSPPQPEGTAHAEVWRTILFGNAAGRFDRFTPSFNIISSFPSQTSTSRKAITIDVGLDPRPGHATCTIQDAEPAPPSLSSVKPLVSDRARQSLQSGEIITASIKVIATTPTTTRFLLRVAVLPR